MPEETPQESAPVAAETLVEIRDLLKEIRDLLKEIRDLLRNAQRPQGIETEWLK